MCQNARRYCSNAKHTRQYVSWGAKSQIACLEENICQIAAVGYFNTHLALIRGNPLLSGLFKEDTQIPKRSILKGPGKEKPGPKPWLKCGGAGDGNRTRVMSLEGSGSTIELHPHGRDDRIRTCDILLPKQARYQAAPRPVAVRHPSPNSPISIL